VPLPDAREVADDVLVQPLTGAHAEGEAVVRQDLHGRRGLGDDRGVVAERRARHAGGEADP